MGGGKRRYVEQRLAESFDNLTMEGERLIEDLVSKVHVLPVVQSDGNSECPFAEELYADKEEREEKLRYWLRKGEDTLGIIKEEIQHLQQTESILNAGANRVVNSGPRSELDSAAQVALRQIKQVAQQHNALSNLLTRAGQVLGMSQKIRFPGRKPRKATPPLHPMSSSSTF